MKTKDIAKMSFVALVAAVLLPLPALAQDAITGVSIEAHATFHNAGVMVTYTGDANGDATAAPLASCSARC